MTIPSTPGNPCVIARKMVMSSPENPRSSARYRLVNCDDGAAKIENRKLVRTRIPNRPPYDRSKTSATRPR
jgi:hypothetical protein